MGRAVLVLLALALAEALALVPLARATASPPRAVDRAVSESVLLVSGVVYAELFLSALARRRAGEIPAAEIGIALLLAYFLIATGLQAGAGPGQEAYRLAGVLTVSAITAALLYDALTRLGERRGPGTQTGHGQGGSNPDDRGELERVARKVGRSVEAWFGGGAVTWTMTSSLSLGAGPTAGMMLRLHRRRLRRPLTQAREGGEGREGATVTDAVPALRDVLEALTGAARSSGVCSTGGRRSGAGNVANTLPTLCQRIGGLEEAMSRAEVLAADPRLADIGVAVYGLSKALLVACALAEKVDGETLAPALEMLMEAACALEAYLRSGDQVLLGRASVLAVDALNMVEDIARRGETG